MRWPGGTSFNGDGDGGSCGNALATDLLGAVPIRKGLVANDGGEDCGDERLTTRFRAEEGARWRSALGWGNARRWSRAVSDTALSFCWQGVPEQLNIGSRVARIGDSAMRQDFWLEPVASAARSVVMPSRTSEGPPRAEENCTQNPRCSSLIDATHPGSGQICCPSPPSNWVAAVHWSDGRS